MTQQDILIRLSNLGKSFQEGPHERSVLSNISLSIRPGEIIAVMGSNGTGKSTLAKIIAGVEESSDGQTDRAPALPPQAPIIFQDYRASLLPWMSVEANIGFPLQLKGVVAAERQTKVAEMLKKSPIAIPRGTSVSKLSGGEAQLVCILRGLICSPPLLICDEPFSSIDYQARRMLRRFIGEISREKGIALFFISHSIEDTVYLADRILILGGTPSSIIEEIRTSSDHLSDPDWLDRPEAAAISRKVRQALDGIR